MVLCGSVDVDAVLGALEDAVLVDVPGFQGVGARRAGVEVVYNLLRSPWPEGLGFVFGLNAQLNLYLLIPAGKEDWCTVLSSFGVVPDGIV